MREAPAGPAQPAAGQVNITPALCLATRGKPEGAARAALVDGQVAGGEADPR